MKNIWLVKFGIATAISTCAVHTFCIIASEVHAHSGLYSAAAILAVILYALMIWAMCKVYPS